MPGRIGVRGIYLHLKKGSPRSIAMIVLALVLCLGPATGVQAQVVHQEVVDTVPTPVPQLDVVDVIKMALGIKRDPLRKSERKGETGPFFSIIAYPGYAIATGFAGVGVANISFRTKKNPKGTLSFINNQFQYTQYNQVIFQSLSNFYTSDEKWQFPGDVRFFHFPTYTYGLSSNSLPSAADNIDYEHFRFYRTVYRQVYDNTYVGLGYNMDYRWNIKDHNANANGTLSDYQRYGLTRSSMSSGFSANFLYDSRDNANRPIKGNYVNIQFNTWDKPFGSTSNWNSLVIDIRQYVPVTHKWYTVFAFWGYAWITLNGKPPYLDMPSVGWDSYNNTGRGYAAGRYRGRSMLYFETEFRFDILRNGLLGGVVFGNVETLSDYPGKYFGAIQPGGGMGLRIKFNKHTQSNSSIDYGFGTHGSNGLATNLNEVF
ncbi:MAG: BamA/TamA family outer membrane protein [Bacteroidetes bacterium]|nr:BamA/TamA family outer membrane protein [Bacteroidota bacterium]